MFAIVCIFRDALGCDVILVSVDREGFGCTAYFVLNVVRCSWHDQGVSFYKKQSSSEPRMEISLSGLNILCRYLEGVG